MDSYVRIDILTDMQRASVNSCDWVVSNVKPSC